jgi:hypothetical protein
MPTILKEDIKEQSEDPFGNGYVVPPWPPRARTPTSNPNQAIRIPSTPEQEQKDRAKRQSELGVVITDNRKRVRILDASASKGEGTNVPLLVVWISQISYAKAIKLNSLIVARGLAL